jgi:hypothetical protein
METNTIRALPINEAEPTFVRTTQKKMKLPYTRKTILNSNLDTPDQSDSSNQPVENDCRQPDQGSAGIAVAWR